LNIKWSTVCSSSSQGHIRLSVSPSLYKYDFMLPCPVSKVEFYSKNKFEKWFISLVLL